MMIIFNIINSLIFYCGFILVISLQNACRHIILRRVKRENIYRLPVPTKIKEFLCFELS